MFSAVLRRTVLAGSMAVGLAAHTGFAADLGPERPSTLVAIVNSILLACDPDTCNTHVQEKCDSENCGAQLQ